jgi:hypothetical protein
MKSYRLAAVFAALLAVAVPISSPAQLVITNTEMKEFNVSADSTPGSAGYFFSYDVLTNSFAKWSGPETLVSVEITIFGRNTGSFFVGASPAVSVTDATAQQNFSFIGGGGPASIFDASPYTMATEPGPLPQLSSVGMFNLPDGPNLWQLNGTYTYTDPALLASYFTGAGTFELRLNNLLQIFATGGTPIGAGLISTGDVTVTMTAVPEPSSFGLLLLAGAAAGGAVWRRRRR